MKKVGVFFFISLLMFIISCKNKEHVHSEANMKHFYKVFPGKIMSEDLNRSNNDSIFNYVTFNDSIRRYFKNTNNILSFKIGSNVKVYQYIRDKSSKLSFDTHVLGSDTVIVINNDSVQNNSENGIIKATNSAVGRGNFGCIPKFEKNINDKLIYFEESGNRYIPLMRADHSLADPNLIVHYLTNYNFKISTQEYNKIDSILSIKPNIEGGLNRDSANIYLIIFNQADTLLTIKQL